MPVLMNAFGSFKRLDLLLKTPIESLQQRMQAFLHFNAPKNFTEGLKVLKDLWDLRHIFPKKPLALKISSSSKIKKSIYWIYPF